MLNLYDTALMLVRVFAGLNVASGGICLIVAVVFAPVIAEHGQPSSLLFGVVAYLAGFGVAALLGGVALGLFSKRIAHYASKP
jgi:hypothetical protein